jgi:4-hydroxy-tetrahydrodipicolinate reductase
MGQLIGQLAPQHGFEVVARLKSQDKITRESLAGAHVAIEFTAPEAALSNLHQLASLGVPSVTGTTGWLSHLDEVRSAIEKTGTGLVWSPNFSVGVAVFRRLVGMAAELLRDDDNYGAWAWEIHHDAKKDAPSGTLLQLVETMKQHGYRKLIDVSSSRAGKHPGTHEVGFDSAADTITLRHAARNREGFAHGALKAARWILGRRGVYTFEEVLFGTDKES